MNAIEPIDFEVEIFRRAEDQEVNPALLAHQYDLPISSSRWWWKPQDFTETNEVYANVDILAGQTNLLARYTESVAAAVKFPRSTAYLHALGVMSAAMTENFFYKFDGSRENTVALYTVGAQPPSTGKSGIDFLFSKPAREAYALKASENAVERAKINAKISKIERDLKSPKTPPAAFEGLTRDLLSQQEELKKYPNYKFSSNNPTPEGCETLAVRNSGWCNVVSDESAAVKVVLGVIYGKGASTSNNGIFLSMWDNGYLSVDRASRDGFDGDVRGAVALLAQDASINTILEAGQGGEGISERFLMIRERNLLGKRDHHDRRTVDAKLKEQYEQLIKNIIYMRWQVTLEFAPGAEQMIYDIKQEYEPWMADGGRFSSAMMRGVVGKADKQICKIASVLHVVENWCEGGPRSKEVQAATVRQAIVIFQQLMQAYSAAADSAGYTGEITELQKIVAVLAKAAGKNQLKIDVRKLRDSIKNMPQFMGGDLTRKIKEDYLPKLEAHAFCVYDKKTNEIFINPYLKE